MPRRSNPMPTMGALFITNPRRKNPMATRRRRNGLALRRNGALNKMIAKKIKVNIRTKGGREAVKQYKRTPAYKKWAASAATKRALSSARTAAKKRTSSSKAFTKKYGTSRAYQYAQSRGYMGSDAKKKSASKKKSSGGKKKLSAYNKFVKARFAAARKAGVETSMGQIADEWARKKAGKSPSPAKKRKSTAKKKSTAKSKSGKKLSAWQRHVAKTLKAGGDMKQASKTYKKKASNPSRRRRNPVRRRRNGRYGGLALRKNQGLPFVQPVADAVDRYVPVVGKPIAEFIPSLAVAGVSALGVGYLHQFLENKDYIPTWAQPFSYTMVGVGGALATLAVPVGDMQTRRTVAAGMAMVGAGIDVISHFFGADAQASADVAAMEAAANGDLGALAYKRNRYGALAMRANGGHEYGALAYKQNRGYGAYEYTGGALNNPVFRGPVHSEIHYSDADAAGAYMDSESADAAYAPGDFDAQEAQVLLMGPQAFFQRFGKPAHSMYNRQSGGASKHAGKAGHRWGWMVKLVGFKGMQQLASMPPAQRRQMIAQLKSQAQQALLSHSGNILPDQPHVFEESGPTGAHGYGAFMYKGGAL